MVEDQGFLPEDVISVTGWFCRMGQKVTEACPAASGRYFNEIDRPDYWEIMANSTGGSIHDKHHLRGRIFYIRPGNERLVRKVEWLDETGVVRLADLYNQRGLLYGRTTHDASGQLIQTSWFDEDGRERLTENAVTRDLILQEDGKMQILKSRTELVIRLFQKLGLSGERIFYNSLSTPFFVSERLPANHGKHLLFWQEPPRNDIPGNMLGILNGSSHTEKVLVQNRESLGKLLELGADAGRLQLFGFLYPFSRENRHGRDLLICTNSDQIESLGQLVQSLPDMHFHIAAITEMSSRLLSMDRYSQVTLYPVAQPKTFQRLYNRCDYYLDINYGSEIVSAVREAYLHNHLILGFAKTQHERAYTAPEHVFQDASRMADMIRRTASDGAEMDRQLALQRKAALNEPQRMYQNLFEGKS